MRREDPKEIHAQDDAEYMEAMEEKLEQLAVDVDEDELHVDEKQAEQLEKQASVRGRVPPPA